MPKLIEKIGIGQLMFSLLYLAIALFAVTGNNILDKFYFISLTIYYLRMFLHHRKKKRMNTA